MHIETVWDNYMRLFFFIVFFIVTSPNNEPSTHCHEQKKRVKPILELWVIGGPLHFALINVSIYSKAPRPLSPKLRGLQGRCTLLTSTQKVHKLMAWYTNGPWIPSAYVTHITCWRVKKVQFHLALRWLAREVIVRSIACMQETTPWIYTYEGLSYESNHELNELVSGSHMSL